MHITSAKPEVLYSWVHVGGPALRVFMLSRAIWALFLSILMNGTLKKSTAYYNLGEGAPAASPLDPLRGRVFVHGVIVQEPNISSCTIRQTYPNES